MTPKSLVRLLGRTCLAATGLTIFTHAQQSAPPATTDLQQGKAVYQTLCAECHGPMGRGDGPKAKKLGFRPRDFGRGAFKCRCTPTGRPPTDEDLLRSVTRGLPGTPMLAHATTLTEPERRAVVQYVKTLSPAFANGNDASCPATPDPPPTTPQAVAEGRQIYRLMQCAKCHGPGGRGDGPSAASLKDDWGDPIKPYNFVAARNFKCGNDDRDIYRTLLTGMTGSPMPSFAMALLFSREDAARSATPAPGGPEGAEPAKYLEAQPDAAAIKNMTEEARRELRDRRTWALVQYLRSLVAR